MAAMEVNFVAIHSCGVVVTAGRLGTKCLWLRAADKVVEVEDIQIVQGFFTIPSTEDVKLVAYFVA